MRAITRTGAAICLGVLSVAAAGCGSTTKPAQGRGKIDSPITGKANYLACIQKAHLPVQQTSPTSLQIGSPSAGPLIRFAPTPGAAQALQMNGSSEYQGAEVIGAALLYPGSASDDELKLIESCLGKSVTG